MKLVLLLSMFILLWSLPVYSQNDGELPKLYETVPEQLFQSLGTVGAGAKTILEARNQLQREAQKVSADAVVAVSCEEGGIKRDGLTFAKVLPYCRGMAVKWVREKNTP